jgi:hypothetical protein
MEDKGQRGLGGREVLVGEDQQAVVREGRVAWRKQEAAWRER